MATNQVRNQSYRILFLYHSKRYTLKLSKVSRDAAESKANQIDYLLMRIKQKLLALPPGVSVQEFMLHDGKSPQPEPVAPNTPQLSLGQLKEKYLSTHRNGALEQNSLGTVEMHLRHVPATIGEGFPILELRPSRARHRHQAKWHWHGWTGAGREWHGLP
jgi:hypothetical protein